jgi:hypothetical protein
MSGTTRCIYCCKASDSSKNIPHAYPEALFRRGPVFPIGTICDKCNQYLGNELETMLVQHPLISAQIQSYGLPGKKGVRKKLGVFERPQAERPVLRFLCQEPAPRFDERGIRIGFSVTPVWNPNFDMDRFSRGLHMIAFNLAVANRGIETAFGQQYDAVRKYIRQPKRGERWPFLQVIGPNKPVKLVPEVRPIGPESGGGEADFVMIEQFNFAWCVDLSNSGLLRSGGIEVTSTVGASWEVIDQRWTPPEDRPIIREDGMRVWYRAEIR